MSAFVFAIGDFTTAQLDLIREHLSEKGIVAPLEQCPEMEVVQDAADNALSTAAAIESEEGGFYGEAFIHRTGHDLSMIVAVVVAAALEETFYQFANTYPSFFEGRPTFILHADWVDEK